MYFVIKTSQLPLFLFALMSFGQISCSSINRNADEKVVALLAKVKNDLQPLESAASSKLSREQRSYLDFYGIQPVPHHQLGSFQSGDLTLAGQLLHPARPRPDKGTVVIVHGYFDHACSAVSLIDRLLDEGYHVAIYDQPGHGLSDGRRASIEDFSVYQSAFSKFLNLAVKNLPPPHDVVAHSMGSTVVIDHLNEEGAGSIRRLIFIAPLIKDTKSRSLHAFGAAISPFVEYLGRIAEPNSSNLEYLEFVSKDPLQSASVSTRWAVAFNRWRKEFPDSQPRTESPFVIYAGLDTTVDNEFGQFWIKNVFPRRRQTTIAEGSHQLHNEAPSIRTKTLNLMIDELEGSE